MRSSHDQEDRIRYWLADAVGGDQPVTDKVFVVMSNQKSIIALLNYREFTVTKIDTFNYCFFNTEYNTKRRLWYTSTHSEVLASYWPIRDE